MRMEMQNIAPLTSGRRIGVSDDRCPSADETRRNTFKRAAIAAGVVALSAGLGYVLGKLAPQVVPLTGPYYLYAWLPAGMLAFGGMGTAVSAVDSIKSEEPRMIFQNTKVALGTLAVAATLFAAGGKVIFDGKLTDPHHRPADRIHRVVLN